MKILSLIFNVIGAFCLFSPPFLAFFVWKKFLSTRQTTRSHQWRDFVEWTAILSISGLFVASFIAFLTIPCNVDLYGWACVAKWRSFSSLVVRASPAFLLLAILGRKGTRILSILWIVTVNFDCIMIDMMA